MARSAKPQEDLRMQRRVAKMGAQENKVEVAARPIPGLPQNQKAGNNDNHPGNWRSFNQQLGALPESGGNKFPYGDGGIALTDGRMGAVGPIANSGQPQNLVKGQRQNSTPYGMPQLGAPDNQTAGQMEAMFTAGQAANQAQKLYAGQKDPTPSYQVVPGLGMSGMPAQMNAQQPYPGQIPAQQSQQSGMTLPLQGSPDVQMAQSGMNTGRGGGKDQKPKTA